MKKPTKGNIPCSPSGIKSMKVEKWKELYEWQLLEYGEQSHKIITSIPLREYYELGLICIKNNISIAMFLKTAMRENISDIATITKKIKKEAKPKEDSRQGRLF